MLSLHNISKTFGSVSVLKGIHLDVKKGEVLGLVGENGAGKSTLMNIIGGVFPATLGTMKYLEQPYKPRSPKESFERGIAFIHQELNLFPNLTISENLFIQNPSRRKGLMNHFIDSKIMHQKAQLLLKEVGLEIDSKTLVEQLTNAQQQMVEIAKALAASPEMIIFDEPTTSLSRYEAETLFRLIAKFKNKGIGVIYISHNLEDVLNISDRIAVLRDGELVRKGKESEFTKALLVRMMVGRDLDQYFPKRDTTPETTTLLDIHDLNNQTVSDISFSVKKGEVLGFYGLVGSGRSELAQALYGLDKVDSGSIKWKGKTVARLRPAAWIRQGLVFLTEDRREEGLLMSKNIRQNIRLAALPKYASRYFGWLDRSTANLIADEQAEATGIRAQNLDEQEVRTLSGGNQQKTVLSKWLMTHPELLILDEPTKGIDIGAKKEIYQLINKLVENRASVLLISSEIEELLGMCDRVLVMNNGQITGIFEMSEMDRSVILEAALPSGEKTDIL